MLPHVSASFCFFATDIHSVNPPLHPFLNIEHSFVAGHFGQLHRTREPDDGTSEGHQARAAAHA